MDEAIILRCGHTVTSHTWGPVRVMNCGNCRRTLLRLGVLRYLGALRSSRVYFRLVWGEQEVMVTLHRGDGI